jgi:SEC-C motif-containing protein
VIANRSAETAEALMRSRYVAYVLHDTDYLLATWHPAKRPRALDLGRGQRWLGLRIKRTERGFSGDSEGVVEFVARYKIQGRGYRLHEVSRFVRINGSWVYLDGELLEK